MNLDLRIPIGLLFSLLGVILIALGAASHSNALLYTKSLGINVNLWWGIVLLIFGQAMFQFGRRGQRALEPPSAQLQVQPARRRKR